MLCKVSKKYISKFVMQRLSLGANIGETIEAFVDYSVDVDA